MKKQNNWAARLTGAMLALSLAAGASAASDLDKVVVSDKATTKALGVVEAKSAVKDGDKVTVEGKVKDIVAGQAVFTLADTKMKDCKENGENCPTPWDYCCETKETIAKNTATVKVVGEAGGKKALKGEIKGLKGIDHLVKVTAEGTAQKDKAGNLIVLAEKLYVSK